MPAEFLIEDVATLSNGKVMVVGLIESGELEKGMKGSARVGDVIVTVEINSIGIVSPRPADPRKQLLDVSIGAGYAGLLQSQRVLFV